MPERRPDAGAAPPPGRDGWVAGLKLRLHALWLLFHHPQTPRAARWVSLAVLAYALSPIDLIPDFIPVLGQLDDLVILPLGVWLVMRLVPAGLWAQCLQQAAERNAAGLRPPRWRAAAVAVVLVWLATLLGLAAWWWSRHGA